MPKLTTAQIKLMLKKTEKDKLDKEKHSKKEHATEKGKVLIGKGLDSVKHAKEVASSRAHSLKRQTSSLVQSAHSGGREDSGRADMV